METIRVLIIEEQPLFREGIRSILERMGWCRIVGASIDAGDVLELIRVGNPGVALIGADLTSFDPLDFARHTRFIAPHMGIVLLSSFQDEERLFQSMKMGVAAYCMRDITPGQLTQIIRKVGQGEYLINDDVLSKPDLVCRVLTSFHEVTYEESSTLQYSSSPLSLREINVLDSIAHGKSNKDIAAMLKISEQTVKNYMSSILKKLSVNDRTVAVVTAVRHGWITLDGIPTK